MTDHIKLSPQGQKQLEAIVQQLNAEDAVTALYSTEYTGTIQVGDKVNYHGSLKEYYEYNPFTVGAVFNFADVPCVQLNGTRTNVWIQRCRESSCTKV